MTTGNKPDVFYEPRMSTGDFIDIEKKLYNEGFYDYSISTGNLALTPVVDLLFAADQHSITPKQLGERIDSLKKIDYRNDLSAYFYRRSVNQQYQLSLNGGDDIKQYYLSLGYDRNSDNTMSSSYKRITVNMSNTYRLLNDRLQVSASVNYVRDAKEILDELYIMSPFYPYARFVDDDGIPLSIVRDYAVSYKNSAVSNGLLNWDYKPYEELSNANHNVHLQEIRLNSGLSYKVTKGLQARILYMYQRHDQLDKRIQGANSYYARNLINSYTQLNETGNAELAIPGGAIIDHEQTDIQKHNFRSQLNYSATWEERHSVTAIAGFEIQDISSIMRLNRVYGYDEEHALGQPVNYLVEYKQFTNASSNTVPYVDDNGALLDRNVSYYVNGSYQFNQTYILSASARLDRSNLFGVSANQKGVPLYSMGSAWEVSKERFYRITWLPYLKLRLTYGKSGNVYKNVSAYTTASYGSYYSVSPNTGLPYARIVNPPNPQLAWEKVRMTNLAIDFGLKNNMISGSFEYYRRKSVDLIGTAPFDPTTGINTFTGNNSSMKGNGFDLLLNTTNTRGKLAWKTNLNMSFSKSLVDVYELQATGSDYVSEYGLPVAGRPLRSVFSFPSAGLDGANGDPRGYYNGEISKDYYQMAYLSSPDDVRFNGPADPEYFGSLGNLFNWNNFSLSVSIAFRCGYYFRKNSVSYNDVLNAGSTHGDYSLRWKAPGDERHTHVPSLPAMNDQSRSLFYLFSDDLVYKADNVRLQYISFDYQLTKNTWKSMPFQHMRIYAYANNLGLLWTAAPTNIDADYQSSGQPPLSLSLGLNISL